MASQCQRLRSFFPFFISYTWGSAYLLSSGQQTHFSIIPPCQLCKWKSEWVGKLFCSKDLETAHPTSACIPRETRNTTEKGKFLGPERHLGARKHDLQSEGPDSTKGTLRTLHTANQESCPWVPTDSLLCFSGSTIWTPNVSDWTAPWGCWGYSSRG